MRFRMRDFVFGLAALLCAQASAQIEGMEISGFRVPEYDEQGQMTSQLFGDHARMGKDGVVRIDGVRVEFYREGDVFLTATAPYCFYDRNARRAESDAPLRAEMEGFLLTGKGFDLEADGRTVHVKEESRVEISDVMQQSDIHPFKNGDAGATNSLTVITSKELFLDYSGRSAKFVDSVHVDDSQLQMDSGMLEIAFGEKNEIDWIQALTDVRILNEGREAYADKAVYDVKTDEFILEGNPRLADGDNMLMGDRIRFWRASEKMVCEPQARLVIYPDEKLNADILEKQ